MNADRDRPALPLAPVAVAARPHDADLGGLLAAGWTPETAAEVEAWHYRFAARTFACRVEEWSWGRTLVTPAIADPEWNHVSGLRWTVEDVEPRLREAARWLEERDRAPVVVVTPWSEPAELDGHLAALGWRPRFRHQWSFYDLAEPVRVEPVVDYEYLHVATPAEMEEWIEVFVAVYDEDGGLDSGYGSALRRSLDEPGVRHDLIRHHGRPVAIGTVVIDGERSQIFNMVVRDGHRRRGLAEWLLNERLRQARQAGASRLTALSDNARIDRWLEQRGFVPGWFSVGYALGGAP